MTSRRSHLRGHIEWLALVDAACLATGVLSGVIIRLGYTELNSYLIRHLDGWLIFCGSVILGNYVTGSYSVQIRFSRFNLVVSWLFSLLMGLLILAITSYAWLETLVGRGVLINAVTVYTVLWILTRIGMHHWILRSPRFKYRVVLLGADRSAADIRDMVENPLILPRHEVVAFVSMDATEPACELLRGAPAIKAPPQDIASVIRGLNADVVIISVQASHDAKAALPQLARLRFEGVTVLTALDVAEVFSGRIPLDWIDEDWIMRVNMLTQAPLVIRTKRFADVLAALIASVVVLPCAALIAAAIKISSPRSPVIYSQDRVGRFGRTFRIHKFRTMVHLAEAGVGAVWSPPNDARVTRLGRLLRRFRLDEIPQLINVLEGNMSIVGPRPERPEFVSKLEKAIPFYRERENVMPGLTGWAQIRYPYGNSLKDARAKLEYDLYYIKNLSLALDLQIILRTLRVVLFGIEVEPAGVPSLPKQHA